MSIIIQSKARVFGECINSLELLKAAKNPLFFADKAPITLCSKTFMDTLTLIFLCEKCSRLHFLCGKLSEGETISRKNIVVYADHTTDGKYITKKEMIDVLENLQKVRQIILQHIYYPVTYTLTEITKCHEECPAVHLDSGYNQYSPHLN